MESISVGFSVFHRKVGRFFIETEKKRNRNRPAFRSVSRRNQSNDQRFERFGVHVLVLCGEKTKIEMPRSVFRSFTANVGRFRSVFYCCELWAVSVGLACPCCPYVAGFPHRSAGVTGVGD
ncbi:unnamed protein product, partial [Laminaria digitata]